MYNVKSRRNIRKINIYVVKYVVIFLMCNYIPVAIMLLGSCAYNLSIVFFPWATVTLNGAAEES
jgi:uncharacterized membrane protein